jgi:Uri superfamily endonuclease
MKAVTLIPDARGRIQPGGTYLLWVEVPETVWVRFGRAGLHAVAAGHCVYVGSALSTRGATSLKHRLLRHASRAEGAAHPLRDRLATAFNASDPLQKPSPKRLHWHIDHLLERPEVRLAGVLAWCDGAPRDSSLASMLAAEPALEPVAIGLGASDRRGETHLFHTHIGRVWWQGMCRQARSMAE